MIQRLMEFLSDERGLAHADEAVMLAMFGAGTVAAISALGNHVQLAFNETASHLVAARR